MAPIQIEGLLRKYADAHGQVERELESVTQANRRLAEAREALAVAEKALVPLIPDTAQEARATLPGGVIVTLRRPGSGPQGIVTREKVDLFLDPRPTTSGSPR